MGIALRIEELDKSNSSFNGKTTSWCWFLQIFVCDTCEFEHLSFCVWNQKHVKGQTSLNISGETLVKHGYSNPQMIDFRHILLKNMIDYSCIFLGLALIMVKHGKTLQREWTCQEFGFNTYFRYFEGRYVYRTSQLTLVPLEKHHQNIYKPYILAGQ